MTSTKFTCSDLLQPMCVHVLPHCISCMYMLCPTVAHVLLQKIGFMNFWNFHHHDLRLTETLMRPWDPPVNLSLRIDLQFMLKRCLLQETLTSYLYSPNSFLRSIFLATLSTYPLYPQNHFFPLSHFAHIVIYVQLFPIGHLSIYPIATYPLNPLSSF